MTYRESIYIKNISQNENVFYFSDNNRNLYSLFTRECIFVCFLSFCSKYKYIYSSKRVVFFTKESISGFRES